MPVTMPTKPVVASLEAQLVSQTAAVTNPFTGKQQVFSWGSNYFELSVVLPPMYKGDADSWLTFFRALNGQAGTFTFPPALCAIYLMELVMPDGITPRVFRLNSNSVKWSIKPSGGAPSNGLYSVAFECREVLA